MARIKKKRVNVAVDMTPLVDVAFLLLTFFMMTTQFKPPEEVEVSLPASHSEIKLPGANLMTIWINKESKIYLGFDAPFMMQTLFGKDFRLKSATQVKKEELANYLIKARMTNPKLRTIIRGDVDVEYGIIADIIDILQKTQITRFAMVTNFKNK
ncbi:MAG: biopolymer transporter ExbD [Ignavibacteria bacterium CG22_combo_CG10-13_8_21_14_all_37_15]|nr:biopolymer transporter ExbD [Ignavibacteria bacterium]PIP77786.1 MAG: biopolymer transporter ExbD [Ignavibacteria bacterium CG22_combo_CG10-13_8_21_14_all_37_15]